MKQQDHYRQILALVHRIGRLVNPQQLPPMGDHRLALSQFLVLDALSVADTPVRMTELARLSGLQMTELSRVVSGLEDKQWLHRSVDADDARVKLVRLSASGGKLIRRTHREANAELGAVWDDFTHEEWHRFIDYLMRFEAGVRRARSARAPRRKLANDKR